VALEPDDTGLAEAREQVRGKQRVRAPGQAGPLELERAEAEQRGQRTLGKPVERHHQQTTASSVAEPEQ
jgi:hypothetical protein